jgi:Fis family transcriptional regulator, factor for inversion stimulation protein
MLADDWPTLEVLGLRYVHLVLEHHGGNKTHAAKTLGVDRTTLRRILARERAKSVAALRYRSFAITRA